jgi:hypothetical protein
MLILLFEPIYSSLGRKETWQVSRFDLDVHMQHSNAADKEGVSCRVFSVWLDSSTMVLNVIFVLVLGQCRL